MSKDLYIKWVGEEGKSFLAKTKGKKGRTVLINCDPSVPSALEPEEIEEISDVVILADHLAGGLASLGLINRFLSTDEIYYPKKIHLPPGLEKSILRVVFSAPIGEVPSYLEQEYSLRKELWKKLIQSADRSKYFHPQPSLDIPGMVEMRFQRREKDTDLVFKNGVYVSTGPQPTDNPLIKIYFQYVPQINGSSVPDLTTLPIEMRRRMHLVGDSKTLTTQTNFDDLVRPGQEYWVTGNVVHFSYKDKGQEVVKRL